MTEEDVMKYRIPNATPVVCVFDANLEVLDKFFREK